MRIVIDLQPVQGLGRKRGIGKYSQMVAQSIVRNRGDHEVLITLNGIDDQFIDSIRDGFYESLPPENIRVWNSPGPVDFRDTGNVWRRRTAELVREAFLASLKPDVVLLTSVFEGLHDNVVTSINTYTQTFPTATILYDLIPLLDKKTHLENKLLEAWYFSKLDHLRRSEMLLAISESSRQESIQYLDFPPEKVINISGAIDNQLFKPLSISPSEEESFRKRFNVNRPFILFVCVIEPRKNVDAVIRAFSKLPPQLRAEHQLVVVGRIGESEKEKFLSLGIEFGLMERDIFFSDYISDDDLLTFYNLCKVFVFPSLHEGLGLPALEAMSCGRATIGSNTSSIPEVIGRDDALFNPKSDESIAEKLEEVLVNDEFRKDLEAHGLKRAKKFSWNITAKRAIKAFEGIYAENYQSKVFGYTTPLRPKLAYVSPHPPHLNVPNDFISKLLPELNRHYDIDIIVFDEINPEAFLPDSPVYRHEKWFRTHASRYDRVIYHFYNAPISRKMFDLLEDVGGIVILNDYFLFKAWRQENGEVFDKFEIYRSHGYNAIYQCFQSDEPSETIQKFSCNLRVLQNAQGVIANSEKLLKRSIGYLSNSKNNIAIVPYLQKIENEINKSEVRKKLNLDSDDFLICSFGDIFSSCANQRFLEVWLNSDLLQKIKGKLIFFVEQCSGDDAQELLNRIDNKRSRNRIRILGFDDVDAELFQQYVAIADLGVYLRSFLYNDASSRIYDFLGFGLPTIVNFEGDAVDCPNDAVFTLTNDFSDEQLAENIESLWKNESLRKKLGDQAHICMKPRQAKARNCAYAYHNAIEKIYLENASNVSDLTRSLARISPAPSTPDSYSNLARCVDQSIPTPFLPRQLLVDVSELRNRDAKTGIQRVVRNILRELLINPPDGIKVEPVYGATQDCYRYAHDFTFEFLDCPKKGFFNDPVEYRPGDIFLGLDLQHHIVLAQNSFFQQLRNYGVQVQFVVYDLLPILGPDWFPKDTMLIHQQWLKLVSQSDGAICISKSVANEMSDWFKKYGNERARPFKIGWFHLGSDLDSVSKKEKISDEKNKRLKKIKKYVSFLMVGTIEPRKGHIQTLNAFEQLWKKGIKVNLVIVGKRGWMMEKFVKKISDHSKLETHLFWLEGINDALLEKIYSTSSCLIAASYGEGFGLPLIEAAHRKMPLICRDIPVFKEVAGKHAYYYSGNEPSDLSEAIEEWLTLFKNKKHPKSDNLPWISWSESTSQLLKNLDL